ncbi:uncharacterized protein LOC110875143 [Helianthus annuus]|uniref:uncharacterized protein LOC110875143 n=1 Tax=Helianthus annuus TaxID=4232 RepID=UPI0016530C32|nr:uncharacterized protein LOC110875143 [Helianthus annuus]
MVLFHLGFPWKTCGNIARGIPNFVEEEEVKKDGRKVKPMQADRSSHPPSFLTLNRPPPSFQSIGIKVDIVNICEKWAAGPGGFYMYKSDEDRRRQMCFGRNWEPETGYRNCYRSNGFKPPPVPHEFISLAEAAIKDAQLYLDYLPSMYPDTCLVSFYETNGRLGLHQDCDESSDSLRRGLPVVSISIGTSAIFVYGRTKRKRKLKSVCLDSGLTKFKELFESFTGQRIENWSTGMRYGSTGSVGNEKRRSCKREPVADGVLAVGDALQKQPSAQKSRNQTH